MDVIRKDMRDFIRSHSGCLATSYEGEGRAQMPALFNFNVIGFWFVWFLVILLFLSYFVVVMVILIHAGGLRLGLHAY